ncbi:phage Gp37/Gp68 family protein [Pseudanabaena sp. FACHB-1277]|jgi:protein gp37|uniref:Phage Gp37/Gp68 family protein n=1 Tax=Pseudanabaena cinerea FACHB-1277 TaxID=2949581 RepID=A0A926UP82_9CYAN|nr:phage Gp37/Gp68 family protein [Pseudanabaena cinerea]MBD2148764.1 phage Gp37/Gp68 family protein [Pseudanabaena cinerea FACHB-1277]
MSSANTGIEWTDKTWNPTTGCDKVSAGCKYCYAEAITERFTHNFPNGFNLTLHEDRIDQPRHWRKPSRIFVNSMSDLFHDDVPLEFLHRVFKVMQETPQHIYQILTKRHERLEQIADKLTWSPNIWMGVSVESQRYVDRVNSLRNIPAAVKFLSCEPLLGSLKLDLTNIDWVIVGGESGRNHRPIEKEWVEDILQQCQHKNVAFFFKQWGGLTPKSGGKILNGETWQEMPIAWEQHLARLSLMSIREKQVIAKQPVPSKVKAVILV